MDWNDISDSMTAFYRAVYDDAFSNLYRSVYTDAYKNVYRTFYDSVRRMPTIPFPTKKHPTRKVACIAQSRMLKAVCIARYPNAQSNTYRTYSDVHSEFYNDNYDLSKVLGD